MSENTALSKEKKSSFWKWQIGLAVFFLILITVAGGGIGYWANIQETPNSQATQAMMEVLVAIQEQFYLGKQALDAERYEDAKTHFEYVIRADTNFPEAREKLAEALIGLYTEPSPTPTPNLQITPTITPTPEIPNEVELLYQAQNFVKSKEWALAVETLQALRFFHPEYQPVETDALLFVALYNRGMVCLAEGDLAGGIYNLERAARFGVLDEEAKTKQEWASFYLAGASYWALDWHKAVYYFGLMVDEAPNFQDASGITTQERYREAAWQYAELLSEKTEWCEAESYFRIALEYGGEVTLVEKLNNAAEMCIEMKDFEGDGD